MMQAPHGVHAIIFCEEEEEEEEEEEIEIEIEIAKSTTQ